MCLAEGMLAPGTGMVATGWLPGTLSLGFEENTITVRCASRGMWLGAVLAFVAPRNHGLVRNVGKMPQRELPWGLESHFVLARVAWACLVPLVYACQLSEV